MRDVKELSANFRAKSAGRFDLNTLDASLFVLVFSRQCLFVQGHFAPIGIRETVKEEHHFIDYQFRKRKLPRHGW